MGSRKWRPLPVSRSRQWSWRWHPRLSSDHTHIYLGMTNETFLRDQQLQWNLTPGPESVKRMSSYTCLGFGRAVLFDYLSWRQPGTPYSWTNRLSGPRRDTCLSHHSCLRLPPYTRQPFLISPDSRVKLRLLHQSFTDRCGRQRQVDGSLWV